MQLHESPSDAQAESRAMVLSRGGGIHLGKLTEDQLVVLPCDADSVVADLDQNRGASLTRGAPHRDPDPPAIGVKLDCIA